MGDSALEEQLAKLVPVSLHSDFSDELLRDCKRVTESVDNQRNTRVHWKRLIPLSIAAALVMVSYFSFRFGDDINKQIVESASNKSPATKTSFAGDEAETSRIVPVSAEGFLIRASSGGIIESENGLVEELNLEYQDAYHWHDPATNTNIRFFAPRQERVLVPVITD